MHSGNLLPRVVVALLISAHVSTAHARPQYTSPPANVFVPNSYVPLSEFVSKTKFQQATMHVEPEILQWIGASNTRVAVLFQGGVSIQSSYVSVNVATGVVTYSALVSGKCVVVSGALLQELPVVTHWQSSLNPTTLCSPPVSASRGGFMVG